MYALFLHIIIVVVTVLIIQLCVGGVFVCSWSRGQTDSYISTWAQESGRAISIISPGTQGEGNV